VSTGHSEVTYCHVKGFISCISMPFVNGSAQEAMFVDVGGCLVKQGIIWQIKTGHTVLPKHRN
jgi:hypothetical protein